MDEQTFMDDLYTAFDDRAQVILSRVDARDWDLLVGVIESTDRVQHMMWRLIDPKHPMYDAGARGEVRRLDRARLPPRRRLRRRSASSGVDPGTPILIVSDHGFHSWRKAVNLNTWLVQQATWRCRASSPARRSWTTCSAAATFWENVDWTRTRAYAMGLGQIYFNLRGREAQGHRQPRRRGAASWPTSSAPSC